MPRKRRCYVPGYPAHVIQRGNARQAVFFDTSDYQFYLHCLREGVQRYGCAVHAYVLMTNHVHLLSTPTADDPIVCVIQHVGRKYVTHINRKHKRSGTLWEGRHKGTVVDCDDYALRCSRYIELNPVRAGMVRDPLGYRWSSYARNTFGDSGAWIVELDGYRGLGATPAMRQAAYRRFFEGARSVDEIDEIRTHVQTGTPLGRRRFRSEIEVMTAIFTPTPAFSTVFIVSATARGPRSSLSGTGCKGRRLRLTAHAAMLYDIAAQPGRGLAGSAAKIRSRGNVFLNNPRSEELNVEPLIAKECTCIS